MSSGSAKEEQVAKLTSRLQFDGDVLRPGFWIYVWRVRSLRGELICVGNTGDPEAVTTLAPFHLMGSDLATHPLMPGALYRCLLNRGIAPTACEYEFIAHGPIYPEDGNEAGGEGAHRCHGQQVIAAAETLVIALRAGYYDVESFVQDSDDIPGLELWERIYHAFVPHFPLMSTFFEEIHLDKARADRPALVARPQRDQP